MKPAINKAVLGETHHRHKIEDSMDFKESIRYMIPQVKRYVKIFSPTLERELYDTDCFRDLISSFCRQSRLSDVRILVQESDDIIRYGHRLTALAKVLPSKISIKLLGNGDVFSSESYILADRHGIVFRSNFESMEGYCNFNAKNEVQNYSEDFDRKWQLAKFDPNFRALTL